MRMFTILFVFAVSAASKLCAAEELNVETLQHAVKGAFLPELRVREIGVSGNRRFVLLTTITVQSNRVDFFNPFGDEETGRCYRISIIDAKGTVLRDIVPATSVTQHSLDPGGWIRVHSRGLIGRSHELPIDALSGLPAGQFSLILIIHRRMVYRSPHGNEFMGSPGAGKNAWQSSTQDSALCCSAPVKITINEQGTWQFPDIGPFNAIDIDSNVNLKRDLSISVKLVNPEAAWLVIPGMNIFSSSERPISDVVTREDGSSFQRHFRPQGGSSGIGMLESHAVYVPKNGVVGGVLPYAGTLEAGSYRVSVQVNESIFRDKLFVNGQKIVRSRSDWPIAFQSDPKEVIVSE